MKLSSFAPPLIHILSATWRFSVEGVAPTAPAVIAFWHDEMLPVWKFFADHKATGLTSMSRDGDMLAALLQRWGYYSIRGSSSREGKQALDEVVEHSKARLVLLTPDGPRGPRHTFKAGAVVAAQRAGVPLYLCRAHTAGLRLHKSWDKFLIPSPFALVKMIFAPPLFVPPQSTREETGQIIQQCERILTEMQ